MNQNTSYYRDQQHQQPHRSEGGYGSNYQSGMPNDQRSQMSREDSGQNYMGRPDRGSEDYGQQRNPQQFSSSRSEEGRMSGSDRWRQGGEGYRSQGRSENWRPESGYESQRFNQQGSGYYDRPEDYDRDRSWRGSSSDRQDAGSMGNYQDRDMNRNMGRDMNRGMGRGGMGGEMGGRHMGSTGGMGSSRDMYGYGMSEGRRDEGGQRFGGGEQDRSQSERSYRGAGPREYHRSDDRIREDVCDRLTDHSAIDASDVEVKVSNGEVTLEGSVEGRHMKHLVEDVADDCSGVTDVQNHLKVRQRNGGGMRSSQDSDEQEGSSSWSSSKKSSKDKSSRG